MTDNKRSIESPGPGLDERAIARKYGIRELHYPDINQVKTLIAFLDESVESGRCSSAVPKTALMVVLDFLQATTIRQHITKSPRMTPDEYDALQTPYYVAARIVAKLQRGRKSGGEKGKLYQTTWVSLAQFADLLRSMLDPSCGWLRAKALPENIRGSMESLRDFLAAYPEQRRKGRAV